jgi:hypothetical protein
MRVDGGEEELSEGKKTFAENDQLESRHLQVFLGNRSWFQQSAMRDR